MRSITLFLLLLLSGSLYGQNELLPTRPVVGREPARARLIPTPKVDTASDYRRPILWRSVEGTEGHFEADCSIPFAWANRQVLLRVASAPAAYEVWVNDRRVAHVQTGALPAEFNLTKWLKNDALNHLELRLLSQAPTAPLEDFYHPEGLGLCELLSPPTIRVRDVVVQTRPVEDHFLAEVGIVVKSDALNRKQARVYYELIDTAGVAVKQGFGDVALSMRGEDTLRFVAEIPESQLWSPASPVRYLLKLRTQTVGRYTEYLQMPIGFRSLELREGTLYLNGKAAEAMIREVDHAPTVAEIEQIRERFNILYPLPGCLDEALLERCDSMGMLLIAPAPLCSKASGTSRLKGGNPTNDPTFRAACIDRAEALAHWTHRHPSVVALTLAHESANGIGLYESYLRLKEQERVRPVLYFDAEGEWNHDKWLIIGYQSVR